MKKIFSISVFLILTTSILSGQSWSTVGFGTNYTIYSLATYNNNLYAGGQFTTAGGISANNIAEWNGASWSALGTGLNSTWFTNVNALAVYNNSLYSGGIFSTAGSLNVNNVASWNGSTWASLGAGINAYVSTNEYSVNAFDTLNGDLYIGGYFDSAGGKPAVGIANWNGNSWSILEKGLNGEVFAMTTYNNQLVIGGNIDSAEGKPANKIVIWNGTNFTAIAGSKYTNGVITSLCVYKGMLIVGGLFDSIGGIAANNVAAWNGTLWLNLGSGIRYGRVYSLATYSNNLYAGGSFYIPGGPNNIAKWNGTTWSSVDGGLGRYNDTNTVYALTVWNGSLYAGGYFDSAGSISVNNIAMLHDTTTGINQIYSSHSITVFPNPSTCTFTFQFSSVSQKSSVEIYNMLGERVYATSLNSSKGGTSTIVSLSDCSAGIYLYRITTANGSLISTGKLIKE